LFLACEVAGLIGAAALWVGTGAGALVRPETYIALNAALQRLWSGALFRGGFRIFGMKLAVEGAEAALPAPFILLVRHSSTADTVLAAALVANPHRILLRYALKRELLWDPCLDVVGRRLPNAFVDRSGSNSTQEIEAVASLGRGLTEREGVLIYPEGTRFSAVKRARVITKLREGGKEDAARAAEDLSHVLPPRPGGTLGLLDAAPGVDVVVLGHTGFEVASSFTRFWKGELVDSTIQARLWRIPAGEVPAADRATWLHERWAELDRWIASKQEEAEKQEP
jgi:1-acyl-sn-glycerol-3-phosphate acyltransferase